MSIFTLIYLTREKCVASYSPLSRSYFKMIELLKTFRLEMDSKPIRSFHLAEGPGGFIEALCKVRKCPYDTYTGITIMTKIIHKMCQDGKKPNTS